MTFHLLGSKVLETTLFLSHVVFTVFAPVYHADPSTLNWVFLLLPILGWDLVQKRVDTL